MNKFILKVALFFALVVVMDFAFGQFFSLLRAHAKGGSTANCEYIANRSEDDIIILGSSRATHHYVPQIIEDSLGVSCYNYGEEGNGIVLAYGRYKMLTSRYSPKLIVYEVTPGYDYGTIEPNSKYLGYLRPYYGKAGIKELFDSFDDELSSVKMLSAMYRNTGKLLPNALDNVLYRDNNRGYSPLYGKMEKKTNKNDQESTKEIDSLKLFYVEKLFLDAKAKGIPFVCVASPRYCTENNIGGYEPAIALCEKYGVPFYRFIDYKPISEEIRFFQDAGHMNNEGAITYTQMLCNEVLNKYIKYINRE